MIGVFLHEKEVQQNFQYYYKIAYKDKDEGYNRENTYISTNCFYDPVIRQAISFYVFSFQSSSILFFWDQLFCIVKKILKLKHRVCFEYVLITYPIGYVIANIRKYLDKYLL